MQLNVASLHFLGNRICIIGPSCAGKSTLAERVGAMCSLPIFHLDQYAYTPNTNYELIPETQFAAYHQNIVAQKNWVIDGNYGKHLATRMERATGVIWLNMSLSGCLCRYFKRSFEGQNKRVGGLEGAEREFSWPLIYYMIRSHYKRKKAYRVFLGKYPIPVLEIKNFKEI